MRNGRLTWGNADEELAESTFQPILSRRELFGTAITIGTLAVLGPLVPAPISSWAVVSFHRDEPYVDPTGMAQPYRSRIATDWATGIDEEALLRLGVTL